jgi:3-carboxy-cis,cis-muconate cycloisomerase
VRRYSSTSEVSFGENGSGNDHDQFCCIPREGGCQYEEKCMPVRLIESLATTPQLAELFSDDSVLEAMLDFEASLARTEATLNIIPKTAAAVIGAAAKREAFDASRLAADALLSGTPSIPLVEALRERVRELDPPSAGFVHWGATSQDLADTSLVLLLKRGQPTLEFDCVRLEKALHGLSERHQNTVMAGRTLLQAAPPVPFGLKAAGWYGAIRRGHARLNASFEEALVVQFGGATGTVAALGDEGVAVGRALAHELDLGYPDAPWHTHRDRLAAWLCACGVLTASLGKMARDLSLLMQSEVGEAAEPVAPGRGGSSTMPHKHNPVGCSVTLAAAHRVPGLVASFLSAMVQEHERAAGGWQAEWPIVAAVVEATGVALWSMAEVAEGLTVDEARMRLNMDATRGAIFAEKASMALGSSIGLEKAQRLLREATRRSQLEGRHLSEVLGEMPEVTKHLDPSVLRELESPEKYLGRADEFRKRLLSRPPKNSKRKKE